jgi:hypothetical protein
MPEISRFFGIIITMYYKEHEPPHFHVEYNEFKAIFDMKQGVVIEGFLPSKQLKLVLAWFEIHSDELFENWNNIKNRKDYIKIKPLS